MRKWIADFFYLFFPDRCAACRNSLSDNENLLCTKCLFQLPETGFHSVRNNPIEMLFAGRIRLHSAGAFWRFQKGGKVQEIMHQLKYKGRKELGNLAGRMYGAHLKKHPDFATIDAILPVPLAPKKLKKRGYNQSACFAEGLSMSMGRPHWNHSLERRIETDSQTNKTRFERWQNVSTVFGVREPQRLQGLHVLLVDDVVTTGATLEACAQELLLIPGLKLSIVTMAYAQS